MQVKRFVIDTVDGGESVLTDNGKELSLNETCNLLNELNDENKELRIQYNNIREQRNEFHRGARENANRVGKLEKENKEFKEINQNNQDYISSLEEEKNNLQIKLQKIRDYAMEDGEVKQGVIEKVMWND